MNFYRWVIFPLISAILLSLSLGICFIAIGFPLIKFGFLLGFVTGGLIGFGLQLFNEYQTKRVFPKAFGNDFEVGQNKTFTMFIGYDETVSLCLKFIKQNLKAKIKYQDYSSGVIEAKTKMGWKSDGNIISFEIRKITEDTTEIEVSTKPLLPTALADFGEGLKIVGNLTDFFQIENEKRKFNALEVNRDILIGGNFDTLPRRQGNYRGNQI